VKGDVMNQSIKQINKSNKPMKESNKLNTRDKQRGIDVVELLFAAATIGAAVLVAAMNSSKRPAGSGD
jgi:hypothetical protein